MKKTCLFIFLFSSVLTFSQSNQLWNGYFSYNSIKDLSQSTAQIYAAAENAYFKKNFITNEITKISTIEGLSGEKISQIHHSESFKKTIIGHNDGLIIVVNEVDGTVLNVVDIINKPSVPPNKKKINHFTEFEGKIYVSTDFGISVFNLATLEFGDTYFIGPGGSNIEILQTTIHNGFIYAVANGFGLIKGAVSNPNLIDFSQWTMVSAGSWATVQNVENNIVATNFISQLYKFTGDIPVLLTSFAQLPTDVRYSNGYLVIASQNYVYLFNNQLLETLRINNTADASVKFTSATFTNNKIYIGTQEKGVLTTTIGNPTVFENITPNSPFKNKIFAIKTFSKGLWAVYGDYSVSYNPYPLDAFPVSKFSSVNDSWTTIPYSDLFDAKSIVRIAINPKNENQVWMSSNYSGVLKIENNIPTTIYNISNSSLQGIVGQVPDDIRTNGSAFDKNGDFWVTNSIVEKGLHVIKTSGQSQGYKLTSIASPLVQSYGRMAIDKNGTKWICSNFSGLTGFNENYNNKCITIKEEAGQGNLPTRDVRAIAIDNNNKLWIGTARGLRILPNVDSFLSQNSLETNSIIILEDNLAQELLYEQFITDIEVDGANNKWIGTAGAGVFFLSPDGQLTYSIFTKENSPLPSNIITDIDINAATGEVFIATESGMVAFKGTSTSGAENLANVIVYPNPVRPEYNGLITITGLMNKSNVKITDIEGSLVYEGVSEGGTMLWDTKAFGKYKVASGVYMLFISSEDGAETKTKKVMIVR